MTMKKEGNEKKNLENDTESLKCIRAAMPEIWQRFQSPLQTVSWALKQKKQKLSIYIRGSFIAGSSKW